MMVNSIGKPSIGIPIVVLFVISVATLWIGITLFNKFGFIKKSVDSANEMISNLDEEYKTQELKIKNDLAVLKNQKIQIGNDIKNLEENKQKSISRINQQINVLEINLKAEENSKIGLLAREQIQIKEVKDFGKSKDQKLKERDRLMKETKISGVAITINPGPPITYDPGPMPKFNFWGTATPVPLVDKVKLDVAMSGIGNRIGVGANYNLRLLNWQIAKTACDLANKFEKSEIVDKAIASWEQAEKDLKKLGGEINAVKLQIDNLNKSIGDQKEKIVKTSNEYLTKIRTAEAQFEDVQKKISTFTDPNYLLNISSEFDKRKKEFADKINSHGFAKLMLFIFDIPALASALSLWALAVMRLFLAGNWFGPRTIFDEKR